jgi:hypothetical protein
MPRSHLFTMRLTDDERRNLAIVAGAVGQSAGAIIRRIAMPTVDLIAGSIQPKQLDTAR